jgi:hypothetical protein
MVVVPLAASENQSARKPEPDSISDSRFWVRAAAAGSLAAGGVLLMTGQRRAGLVVAAAGTALTAFDQSETVRSWWSQFPGYLDEMQKILNKVQATVDELASEGERLRNVLTR